MPELHFEIDTGDFLRNLVGQFRAMRDASLAAMEESADSMVQMIKDNLSNSTPGGRIYYFRTSRGASEKHFPLTTKKTKFGTHIASAGGQPPARLSGDLIESISHRTFFSHGHTRVISEIYSNLAYAYYLEYGAVVGGHGGFPQSYMEPRPFMAPIIFSPSANYNMLLLVRAAMERAGHAYGAR